MIWCNHELQGAVTQPLSADVTSGPKRQPQEKNTGINNDVANKRTLGLGVPWNYLRMLKPRLLM
jgi:hypothetical protein